MFQLQYLFYKWAQQIIIKTVFFGKNHGFRIVFVVGLTQTGGYRDIICICIAAILSIRQKPLSRDIALTLRHCLIVILMFVIVSSFSAIWYNNNRSQMYYIVQFCLCLLVAYEYEHETSAKQKLSFCRNGYCALSNHNDSFLYKY